MVRVTSAHVWNFGKRRGEPFEKIPGPGQHRRHTKAPAAAAAAIVEVLMSGLGLGVGLGVGLTVGL